MRLSFDLLGPQGSGKGTQAKLLLEHFDFIHFDAGEVLRKLRASNDPLGHRVGEYMDMGHPVPTNLIIEVTEKTLAAMPRDKDVLFDGILRGLGELELQKKVFQELEIELPVIILLNIDDATAIERIGKRRICSVCGHRQIVEEGGSEICNRCQGKLERRHDDTPESIRKRLDWYHRDTEPVADYFRKNGTVIEIDARPSIETVGQQVMLAVKQYYENLGLRAPVK